MGNTPEVLRAAYAAKTEGDSADELTGFYDALGEVVASFRTKNYTSAVKTASEADTDRPNGSCTLSTACEPERIQGVTDQIKTPTCQSMIDCLFCTQYALKNSLESIHKLLSLRKWLQLQFELLTVSDVEKGFKFQPALNRIDDIVSAFRARDEACEQHYQLAEKKVKVGFYTDYFAHKIVSLESSFLGSEK